MPANVSRSQELRVEIFDLLGRVVRTYALSAGAYNFIEWDGRNEVGALVPVGVYEYRLTERHVTGSRRLILLN